MAQRLTFSYDREGDILDISIGKPQKALSREITDDFFIRTEPRHGKVVGFSLLNFERWFAKKETRSIPVKGSFSLIKR